MKNEETLPPHHPVAPSWFLCTVEGLAGTGRAESLAQALFALDEPWRGRFLGLVANLATRWAWDERQPTREEVIHWLRVYPTLYQQVGLMLTRWQGPGHLF